MGGLDKAVALGPIRQDLDGLGQTRRDIVGAVGVARRLDWALGPGPR
jgi:hypothetical protein